MFVCVWKELSYEFLCLNSQMWISCSFHQILFVGNYLYTEITFNK